VCQPAVGATGNMGSAVAAAMANSGELGAGGGVLAQGGACRP
jgi:hypothetical protein